MNLNLTGTFLVTQAVGKRSMNPNRYGKIITVASVAGLRGNPIGAMKTLAYNTTKGGLVNFTRALAGEWGEHNITVNAVAPGFFPSRMSRDFLDQVGPQVIARTPLARLGDEQDLKGVAVLLASDASRHITGQIIAVDGGSSVVDGERPNSASLFRSSSTWALVRERNRERAIVRSSTGPDVSTAGAAHGGVIMTMLDLVMSMAVRGHYNISAGVLTGYERGF